jgi:SAM-dependent methyltransferase
MPYQELRALLPATDESHLTAILIRRDGDDAFAWIAEGQAARPGDDLILYAIDKANDDELSALNLEFDRRYYPRQSGIRSDEREVIETRLPSRGARILETCCGAGRITAHLVRDGNYVTGLDFNEHCIAVARERGGANIEYVLGDATRLPFPDGFFDIACCLENGLGMVFSRAPRVLAELIRVTRAGGFVLLGLREQPGRSDRFHLYRTADGCVSVAKTFDADSVAELMASLPVAATARIASREQIAGAGRPWGGATFYIRLTLGEESDR